MAQAHALVDALKSVLKSRGITYARLGKALRLSEASVKRIFAARSFSLERLDQACAFLEIEISDLARMVAAETASPQRLTVAQERELVSDSRLLLVAVHVLNHWTMQDIVGAYAITKAECIRALARLDKLGIIDLMPNNRIRIRVPRDFAWLPDGPIHDYFRRQVQNDFFRSRFDAPGELLVFTSGMLSRGGNASIQSRMKRLGAEFSESHRQDLELPLEQRFGTSLLIALRPWAPEGFKKLQRKPGSRRFENEVDG